MVNGIIQVNQIQETPSYNSGDMAREFLPGCRKWPDYEWAMNVLIFALLI